MTTVQFSATLEKSTAKNIRRGKIFDVKAFKDRGLTVSSADVRNACANFQPVNLDLNHRASILDDKLGRLQSVQYNEATGEIHGVVEESSWLSEVLGDAARRCSITWDTIGKKIIGLAYTLTPHVEDAALFEAFSAATDPKDVVIQQLQERDRAMREKQNAPLESWLKEHGGVVNSDQSLNDYLNRNGGKQQ